ncbi:MAG: DUF1302 family protein [Myxococcota bacterium]|nr:DUF1302 family protein [Myxococcota bacterium]
MDQTDDEDGWGDASGTDSFDFSEIGADDLGSETTTDSSRQLNVALRYDLDLWLKRPKDTTVARSRISAQANLNLKFDVIGLTYTGLGAYDPSFLYKRERFSPSDIAAYEKTYRTQEAYIEAGNSIFNIKFGRIVENWSEANIFPITDLINPRDLREPGFSDIEELKIGILATNISFFQGPHQIQIVMAHEANYGWRPPPLGDFSPLPGAFTATDIIINLEHLKSIQHYALRDNPKVFSAESQQLFARWLYRGSGVDLSVIFASYLDTTGSLGLTNLTKLIDPNRKSSYLELNHHPILAIGHTGSLPLSGFVLRWEILFNHNKPYTATDSTGALPQFSTQKGNQINAVIGTSYDGFENLSFIAEAFYSTHFVGQDKTFLPTENEGFTFSLESRWLRDDLKIQLAVSGFGFDLSQGLFGRIAINYKLKDNLTTFIQAVGYLPGKDLGPISGFTSHDRATAGLKYKFSLL